MTSNPQPSPTRRWFLTTLGVGAVGLWVWGIPRIGALWPAELVFSDIASAPGFQRLETDTTRGLSIGAALFAGLDTPDPSVLAATRAVEQDPCAALFRGSQAAIPIALFSDFNCPNCPRMDANVQAVVAGSPQTSLHFHQLPLLGRTSELAAQAVMAADIQGKYAEMHAALLRTPAVTNRDLMRRIAQDAGLDVAQFERDLTTPAVQNSISTSKALASYLGLFGTPAAVIGRTVVLGVQSEATISAIIAHEEERAMLCN